MFSWAGSCQERSGPLSLHSTTLAQNLQHFVMKDWLIALTRKGSRLRALESECNQPGKVRRERKGITVPPPWMGCRKKEVNAYSWSTGSQVVFRHPVDQSSTAIRKQSFLWLQWKAIEKAISLIRNFWEKNVKKWRKISRTYWDCWDKISFLSFFFISLTNNKLSCFFQQLKSKHIFRKLFIF